MLIRQAQPTDAEELAWVSVRSWKSTYAGLIPETYWDSVPFEHRITRWQNRLEDPDSRKFTLVAEYTNGRIAGYCGGLPERNGNEVFTGEVGDLYLLPECRRQGIGQCLISRVVNQLQTQGHNSILVWCYTDNPFKAFYEKLGGQPIDKKMDERLPEPLEETAYGWRDLTIFSVIPASGDPSIT